MKTKILCFGEILWDCLPSGNTLGGAPLNVACHLQMLGADVSIASALGDDLLGQAALEQIKIRGLSTKAISVIQNARTGIAQAHLDDCGNATYEFPSPCAWDAIPAEKTIKIAEDVDGFTPRFRPF